MVHYIGPLTIWNGVSISEIQKKKKKLTDTEYAPEMPISVCPLLFVIKVVPDNEHVQTD